MNVSRWPMSRTEADRLIGDLGVAYDRISAAMYALDSHPHLAVLRAPELSGVTARVAAGLLARVDVLWSQFTAFSDLLHRAREVRSRRSRPGDTELRELAGLLRAPVVRLGPDGMVLDDASADPPAHSSGLVDLARRIETEATGLAGALSEVVAARTRLVEGFGQLTATVARLRADVEGLGEDSAVAGDLDRLGRQIDEAYGNALGDPLGATRDGPSGSGVRDRLRELTVEVTGVAERIADLIELRDGYPGRVARLAAELDDLVAATTETDRIYAVAEAKIANPGLPDLPAANPALRTQLHLLDQLHRERRWQRLGAELDVVERAVVTARRRSAELYEAADGLLRRRVELRGRLDAYRAKAGRLGLIEHVELSARYRLARDLLYTSPCDLGAATRAVVAYQRQLNDLAERPTPGAKGAVP
ncbi:hypothetical protein I0C86_35465 [Plantactinospora sp. S1510]|uniref:Uncharacterized protein n=1 Tax=Plantactinospora alkalitolerans TaxID=2789879 RepID=A0ABS0H7P4_9ACTN|nr:hypothetical protein [Plantactinospora alkalitolerans]MBF9134198.1 hypothetical protein [Plantactinospora alkalitolerans]